MKKLLELEFIVFDPGGQPIVRGIARETWELVGPQLYLGGQIRSFSFPPDALTLRADVESPPFLAGIELEYQIQSEWMDRELSFLNFFGDSGGLRARRPGPLMA